MFAIHGHPTPDALEEYAFRRLSAHDTEALEEHVLVCPHCQTSLAEVEDYILLIQLGIARYESRLSRKPLLST
jgi:hypothetical protein